MAKSSAPRVSIAAGEILHRIHGAAVDARWYGRRDATWRWDAPDGQYGVLYLGRSPVGPFAESLLRIPSERDLLWSTVSLKRAARFVVKRSLALADLSGAGVAWFETTLARIAEDPDPLTKPEAYAEAQRISARVHAETSLDGIQYRSRFDPSELCVALFDRADDKIEVEIEGQTIDRDWARKILKPRGYALLDL